LGCKKYQRLRASPNSGHTATLRSAQIPRSARNFGYAQDVRRQRAI